MDKMFPKLLSVLFYSSVLVIFSANLSAFELLSEGAMESVSAVSANSAEEIVSLAGPTAAGLRVDEKYESMPFQTDVLIKKSDTDKVSTDLDFALTKEVESWALNLQSGSELDKSNVAVGYVDVLPPSTFVDTVVFSNDNQFDTITFNTDPNDAEEGTTFELGRIEQTIDILSQNLDSIKYIVRRHVEFLATINANPFTDHLTIGSGYITDLSSISNVRISSIRD